MFDSSFGFALIAWICLYVFVTNFRSSKRIADFYDGHKASNMCIQNATVTSKGIHQLRASLGNLAIDDAKPKKYRMSLADHWVKITNGFGVRRALTEQVVVVDYLLETRTPGLNQFKFNRSQVEVFLGHCNDVIKHYQTVNGLHLTQIQRIHFLYLILMELAKRYKHDRADVLLLRPMYDELFKGLPRVSLGVIDLLATEVLNNSTYGKTAGSYSVAMGLKMIYFYSPAFNKYGRIKQFKSVTKF